MNGGQGGDTVVVVRVCDDGTGIPDVVRETLFDPPESGDHGYGLFLSQHLVELYGGRLELDASGPEGTVFRMRLEATTLERATRLETTPPSSRDPEPTVP